MRQGDPDLLTQLFRFALDGVQLANERQHQPGTLLIAVLRIVKLPPRMRPAGDFRHILRMENAVVAAVGIGLQVTFVARKPLGRTVSTATRRVTAK